MNEGVLIIDLDGTELSLEESKLLLDQSIAGVLLFSRNFKSRVQLSNLVDSIRALRNDLLICVDQEGGRVQRFKEDFTQLPPASVYGQLLHSDREEALRLTRDAGWVMASELLACGVDLSLGPVLDIDHGCTDIVGDRAFSTCGNEVVLLAETWIEGVHEAGMSAAIKHFPGHGSVDDDSHKCLPIDPRPFSEIESEDLVPFKALIQSGVEAVMPAHILFPAIDDEPVGFSHVWHDVILRKLLGFRGLTISDCLTMEGAASVGNMLARVEKGLKAGCDLLIVSSRQGVKDVLQESRKERLRGEGPSRLLANKKMIYDELLNSARYYETSTKLNSMVS